MISSGPHTQEYLQHVSMRSCSSDAALKVTIYIMKKQRIMYHDIKLREARHIL